MRRRLVAAGLGPGARRLLAGAALPAARPRRSRRPFRKATPIRRRRRGGAADGLATATCSATPRLQALIGAGAGQQPRLARRRRQPRRGAGASPGHALGAVPRGRRQRRGDRTASGLGRQLRAARRRLGVRARLVRPAGQRHRTPSASARSPARPTRAPCASALVADLAQAWITYAADRDLLAIAEDTAANAEQGGRADPAAARGRHRPAHRLAPGRASARDGERRRRRSRRPRWRRTRTCSACSSAPSSTARCCPAAWARSTASFAALPAGTSSEVLLRRPDVEQAEHLLNAANADIGVARAELFPRISLTGLLGLASDALGALFTGGAFTATAGADAAYTIFDAGGRRANVAVSQAQRDAALASYEKAIQTRVPRGVRRARGARHDRRAARRGARQHAPPRPTPRG